jgi:HD superfamily phosphodiesterase
LIRIWEMTERKEASTLKDQEQAFVEKWAGEIRSHFTSSQFMEDFIANDDHGLPHAARVWLKAQEIIAALPAEEREGMNLDQVERICVFHDAGRFHHRRCDQRHMKCGAAQARIYARKIGLSREEEKVFVEGVLSHDYFTPELTPHELPPQTLEAQIVRAADRMSVDIVEEMKRGWAIAQRYGTPLYNPEADGEFREQWSFKQTADRRTDELCFFAKMLSFDETMFSHPVIQRLACDWLKGKERAKKWIIELAESEYKGRDEVVEKIEALVNSWP